jgi:hypothetical protein
MLKKIKVQVGQWACPVCRKPHLTQAGAVGCCSGWKKQR